MNKVLGTATWVFLCLLLTHAYSQLPAQVKSPVKATYGDLLIYGVLTEPHFNLNPFEINSPTHQEILNLIYGYGLIKSEGKVAAPPSLINQQMVSQDFRTWRIVIERNVVFHNEVNLRSTDVKFTFDLIRKFGGYILNRRFDFDNVISITVNGDLEVVFKLQNPDENFLEKLIDIPIVPATYYQSAMSRGYEVFSETPPVGMGPFIFEYRTQNLLSLRYHLNYYTGRPFLDGVKIQFFDDPQALVHAMVNGDVDYIELPDRNTTDRLLELMRNRMNVITVPRKEVKVYTLLFNLNRFPLSEQEVRQAIHSSINREHVVQRLARNVGSVAHTLFKPTSPFYEKTLYQDSFDPRRGLQLLRDFGWKFNRQSLMMEKTGRALSFKLYFSENSELEQNIARVIKLNLAEININVQPVPIPFFTKKKLLAQSAYEAMLYSYTYDPGQMLSAVEDFYNRVLGAAQPVPNYQNRYMTQMFNVWIKNNPDRISNVYIRLQTFLVNQVPAVFLFFDERILIGYDKRFEEARRIVRKGREMYFQLNPIENWFVPKEKQKY